MKVWACRITSVTYSGDSLSRFNFSEGGWPGLISFTTVPTNNPFGAYAAAQVRVGNAIGAATAEAKYQMPKMSVKR